MVKTRVFFQLLLFYLAVLKSHMHQVDNNFRSSININFGSFDLNHKWKDPPWIFAAIPQAQAETLYYGSFNKTNSRCTSIGFGNQRIKLQEQNRVLMAVNKEEKIHNLLDQAPWFTKSSKPSLSEKNCSIPAVVPCMSLYALYEQIYSEQTYPLCSGLISIFPATQQSTSNRRLKNGAWDYKISVEEMNGINVVPLRKATPVPSDGRHKLTLSIIISKQVCKEPRMRDEDQATADLSEFIEKSLLLLLNLSPRRRIRCGQLTARMDRSRFVLMKETLKRRLHLPLQKLMSAG